MAVKKILSELQIKKIFTLIKDNFAKLNHTHDKATTTTDGFMAAADKVKLDGIETGANKSYAFYTIQMEYNNGELLAENQDTTDKTHDFIMGMINSNYTVALMYQGVSYLLSGITNIGNKQAPTFSAITINTSTGKAELSQIRYQVAGNVLKYILSTKDIVEGAVKCRVAGRSLVITTV